MKKLTAPTYTQIPNSLLDSIHDLTECEMAVAFLFCRETFGWHRPKTRLTLAAIVSRTGRSNGGVAKAIESLCEREIVKKHPSPNGNEYSFLVLANQEEALQPVESGSPTSGEPPLQPVENPNKGKKVLKERGLPAGAGADSLNQVSGKSAKAFTDFIAWWDQEFPKTHDGEKYVVQGGKDGSALKRLLGAGLSFEQLIRIASAAWKNRDSFNCKQAVTIAGMGARINEIRDELNALRRNPAGKVSPAQEIRSLESERRPLAAKLEEYNELLRHDVHRTQENIDVRVRVRERVEAIDKRLGELRAQ